MTIPRSGLAGYLYAPLRVLHPAPVPPRPRRTPVELMATLGDVDRIDGWHQRSLFILMRVTVSDVPHLDQRIRWHVAGRALLDRRRRRLVRQLREVER